MHADIAAASVHPAALKKKCPQTEAVFRRTSNGYARIYFMKNLLDADIITTFFQHEHFRIDQAIDLPISIVKNLDLKDCRVSPGLYKIRAYKDFFIIDLDPLSKVHGIMHAQD